jgi:hypothetical protein
MDKSINNPENIRLSNYYRQVTVRPYKFNTWEVVVRYLWNPFWHQPKVNAHETKEAAIQWAKNYFNNPTL